MEGDDQADKVVEDFAQLKEAYATSSGIISHKQQQADI